MANNTEVHPRVAHTGIKAFTGTVLLKKTCLKQLYNLVFPFILKLCDKSQQLAPNPLSSTTILHP